MRPNPDRLRGRCRPDRGAKSHIGRALGWQSPETRRYRVPELSTRAFVIDGTNVVLLHGRARPELRYVLALCSFLDRHGATFVCYFDANTGFILQEHGETQFDVFEQVMREPRWSGRLRVVPGGTEADEWILRRAKSDGADVISNDKYRNRARDHRWIWKRRHPLVGTSERITLETLPLEIPVLSTAEEYL